MTDSRPPRSEPACPATPDATGQGGKAQGLERLQDAGIAVPAWRLIDSRSLAALLPAELVALAPEGMPAPGDIDRLETWRHAIRSSPLPSAASDELARASAELGAGLVMVRSASALEDRAGDAAAGLFESVGPVTSPGDELSEATSSVVASVATPAVWAYLAARRLRFADVRMAVVVQRFVEGRRATGYTRAPETQAAAEPGGAMLLETEDGAWAQVDRTTNALLVGSGDGPWLALGELGRACERALGGVPVDFEAVITASEAETEAGTEAEAETEAETRTGALRIWAVQARPIPTSTRARRGPDESALAFSRSTPGTEWTWDASHNPEPLSPAQIGLVERVDAAGLAPFSLRVVEGYLYSAPRHPFATAPIGGARYIYETAALPIVAAAEAEADDNPGLANALAAYDKIYDVWANKLAPAVAESRRELPRWLADAAPDIGTDVSALVADLVSGPSDARLETLAARVAADSLGRGELVERVGALATAWDVRCPTLAEQPDAVERLVAGARMPDAGPAARARDSLRQLVPPWRRDELEDLMGRAREAADVAELDDRVFARAQWLVRRSLLRAATLLSLEPDDVFFLPLADVVQAENRGSIDRARAADQIAEARARLERQRLLSMPLAICDGLARGPRHNAGQRLWRGRGCGGYALGPVALVGPTSAPVAAGAIAVCSAITPGMLALVRGAAAFVCERGGLLDHGAAMARSLGVPIVVGCTNATRDLEPGDTVWVDGAAGVACAV